MPVIREQIVAKIKTAMEAVVDNVYNWPTRAIPEEDLPSILVRDPACESFDDTFGLHGHNLTIEVEIMVAEGNITATQCRTLLSQAYAAIGANPGWDNLAILSLPPSDQMILKENQNILGGVLITFIVYYRTSHWTI